MVVLKPHRMFKIAVLAFLSCMVIYIWTVSQRSEGKCLCDDTHHSGSPQEERQLAISDSEAGLFMEGFENPSYGRLLRYIREIWIVPPPTRQTFQKSSWGKERHFSQVGQSEFVDNALGKRRGKWDHYTPGHNYRKGVCLGVGVWVRAWVWVGVRVEGAGVGLGRRGYRGGLLGARTPPPRLSAIFFLYSNP